MIVADLIKDKKTIILLNKSDLIAVTDEDVLKNTFKFAIIKFNKINN